MGETSAVAPSPWRLTSLDLPLVLFWLSALAGLWPAYDRALCWRSLVALSLGTLLYFVVSRSTLSAGRWRAMATALGLAGLLLALYFVTQYGHFGYEEKVPVISRLGEALSRVIPAFVVWGPMPNSIAAFLEGPLFLTVALALTARGSGWQFGWWVGGGLLALALLMTASRGAWLAVAAGALLWAARHWRPARCLAVASALVAVGLVAYGLLRHDIRVLDQIPFVNRTIAPLFIRPDRLHVYRNSLYLIQDFPLTGIGLGEPFALVLSRYALLIQSPFLTYSHNFYLETWLELGLPGLVALTWLMAALFPPTGTGASAAEEILYQGTWVGLAATFIHGLTDARQYVDLWCWLPFFTLLGLNAALRLRQPATPPSRVRRWVPMSAVALLLVAVVIAGWPLPATLEANRGALLQARADLAPALDEAQRATLRAQAVTHYERALTFAPQQRTARQRLGILALNNDEFTTAVTHLEQAWQADPANTTTRKALGLAYVWTGALEQAVPLLQDSPDIINELNGLGWWRSTQNQVPLALNAYRVSLLLNPDQPTLRQEIARLTHSSSP